MAPVDPIKTIDWVSAYPALMNKFFCCPLVFSCFLYYHILILSWIQLNLPVLGRGFIEPHASHMNWKMARGILFEYVL